MSRALVAVAESTRSATDSVSRMTLGCLRGALAPLSIFFPLSFEAMKERGIQGVR
jgi:hypothetical protein